MTDPTYTEQNQRETADHVRSLFQANNKLSDAVRALAYWANWEADDPKSICFNVANYLENASCSRPYTS